MPGSVAALEVVFLLILAFVLIFAVLARKLKTPYPVVLVIAGLILGFVPGMPRPSIDPDVIFLVVLPPLLYAAAWQTSWREFHYNLVSIMLLAFGLVGFLVLAVAYLAPVVLPGFDRRTGFILGAVVSTTDAIAATTIARQLGLPQRIVDILEGESLLNDASGLLALEVGLALIVSGHQPTISEGLLRLLWLTFGGIAIGLLLGVIIDWVERRIDDGPIEVTLSLLVPYIAYLAAGRVNASGVLAVVACGLWLSRRSASFFSPNVRLQIGGVWEALTFAMNGLVFVLIGLQLPVVLSGLRHYSLSTLIISGLLFSLLLIVLRLAWMFPGAYIANVIRRRILGQDEEMPSARQVFVIGWTGMRGVVALAAALALPMTVANGKPFEQRDVILFLTFAVIFVTLVVQGLTLAPLIRAIGLAGQFVPNCEEHTAQELMIEAVLTYIGPAKAQDDPAFIEVYDDLETHYRTQLNALKAGTSEEDKAALSSHDRYLTLGQELLKIERKTLIGLRDEGRINDEVLRRLERKLDLGEERLLAGAH